jgi:L-alanine-DL-glutamate epimerase-like enolase superfamily enzyme
MYLNVALAIPNCDFAEIMVPQNVLSIGMAAEDLPKVDDGGYIAAPQKPGLGYDIDPDAIENLTLQRFLIAVRMLFGHWQKPLSGHADCGA